MRILHVISDENIGGAGVLLVNLLRFFDREKVESIVALPQNSLLIERLRELDVPLIFLTYPADKISGNSVKELRGHIVKNGIEIVHANASVSARIAGKSCSVPVVHTRHCCFPPSGIWRVPFVRGVGGIGNRFLSDCVISTAEAAVGDLKYMGIPEEKIRVIINGTPPVREVDADELLRTRQSLRLDENDFVVGICARLEDCKGHRTFLQAARLVCERMPRRSFRFLILGNGSLRRELEMIATQLGISEVVDFLGFVEDMAPIYRLLRINVNCSNGTETSCLALSEGMSAGVPMIASNFGGNVAMIGDGKAGSLFPVGNARALSDEICRIASDADMEKAMRGEARRRYERYYTAQRMAQEVYEVYKELLHKQ